MHVFLSPERGGEEEETCRPLPAACLSAPAHACLPLPFPAFLLFLFFCSFARQETSRSLILQILHERREREACEESEGTAGRREERMLSARRAE